MPPVLVPTLARTHRIFRSGAAGGLALALAVGALLAFGVRGVGRTGPSNLDANFLIVAGVAWRSGLNPYDPKVYGAVSRSIPAVEAVRELTGVGAPAVRGFSYPPTIAPLCLALSWVPPLAAGLVVTLLNLAAAVALAVCTRRLALREVSGLPAGAEGWIVPAIALASPFVAHVTWIGQTTLFAAAFLAAGWGVRATPGREAIGGILLACSAIKPQVALLPLLWVVLEHDWRVLAALAAAGVALVSVPLLQLGPVELTRSWLDSLTLYQSLGATAGDVNAIGFQNMFGLRHLLAASGLDCPSLTPVALVALGALWLWRRWFSDLEILGLLLAASALLVYAHDYDLAMLAPFLAALWVRARTSEAATAAVAVVLALLFFPQRLLRGAVSAGALHWRELVLCAAVVGLVALAARRAEPVRAAAPPPAP
jgi:hypothetical protein